LVLLLMGVQFAVAQDTLGDTQSGFDWRDDQLNTRNHPAVGSWFGKAVQVCTGDPTKACTSLGFPAIALFMNPSIHADGIFLGNDSLTLGAAPFGPHTTAHGQWVPLSNTDFVADYMFMLNPFPAVSFAAVGAIRFRWSAKVILPDTAVGWVNIYLFPPLPTVWESLKPADFPLFPKEAEPLVTSPKGFVYDPSQCTSPACPLVFKFTIRRVAP